jgi:alpha-glucosidase (family GH31 glycosyl hydrolase)
LFLSETAQKSIQLDRPENGSWYNYSSLQKVQGAHIIVRCSQGRTAIFFTGGGIIPITSNPGKSTELMFDDPFTLVSGLDENAKA